MKRTPLRRKSSLTRRERAAAPDRAPASPKQPSQSSSTPAGVGAARPGLSRRKRINPVNRKRRAAAHAKAFGEKAEWIRAQPCILAERGFCDGDTEAAHVRSRGAGGTSADLIPLCWLHHSEQHLIGIESFTWCYGLRGLSSIAARYEREWIQSREAA